MARRKSKRLRHQLRRKHAAESQIDSKQDIRQGTQGPIQERACTPESNTKSVTEAERPLAAQENASDRSPWWPELYAENAAKAQAAGMGAAIKTMRERRLEMRAVNEHWPISPDLRARLVFESTAIMLDSKADPKLRQRERWLLNKMAEANRVKQLPDQIVINNNGASSSEVNVGQIVRDLLQDSSIIDATDFRQFKPELGSDEDYADI